MGDMRSNQLDEQCPKIKSAVETRSLHTAVFQNRSTFSPRVKASF